MGGDFSVTLFFFVPIKQATGRDKRALEVLGEAIDKWERMPPPPASDGGGVGSSEGSSRHEAFYDRGVIR